MMHWFYIGLASCCEVGWIYSLKYMEFKKLIKAGFTQVFSTKEGLLMLLPVILYVIFGIANIILFSKGMEKIPASVSFAVWTSITLIGVKLSDVFILKEAFSYTNLFFFVLIIIGIIGVKLT